MTPLPPVANTLKINQNWILDLNTTAESIFYFTYTGGTPAAADCVAFAADFQAAAVTNLKSLLSTSNKLGLATCTDIASNTGKQGVGGAVTTGTRTGNANAASTCVVMNHNIARRYRGGKPRTYFPGMTSTDLASTGTWQASPLNTCNSAWSTMITTFLASTSGGISLTNYVNVSYYTGKALRGTPLTDPILNTTARTRIGSQRRRNATA